MSFHFHEMIHMFPLDDNDCLVIEPDCIFKNRHDSRIRDDERMLKNDQINNRGE